MKTRTLFRLAPIIIVCCFSLSCNKQEDPYMPVSGDNSSMSPFSLKSGAVFTVSPGADLKDSKGIQKAFDDAVAAGPGSTVQLTKGTFVLDERIEVEGFVGCFKGAGKDKTIITTPDDKPVVFNLEYPNWESLIKFRYGNIRMSDLTIEISNPEPCTGLNPLWGSNTWIPVLVYFTGNSVKNQSMAAQSISVSVNNVKLIGGTGNDMFSWGSEEGLKCNVAYGITVAFDGYTPEDYYDLYGSCKIRDCEFKSIGGCIFIAYDGTCEIGGDNSSSGNKFQDSYLGVMDWDCSNAFHNISNNCFTKIDLGAIQLFQGAYVDPPVISKFLIRDNNIEMKKYGDAIWLMDHVIMHGAGKSIDATVSDNKIFLDNIVNGGIWGNYAKDVLVSDNKIWGNCLAGIYSGEEEGGGGQGSGISGWRILRNNVQGVNAQVAPIWLNSSSHDNTVIGGSLSTTVLDEGTNNILINVNKKHWDHSAREFHDKMIKSHEMRNSFRGHRR